MIYPDTRKGAVARRAERPGPLAAGRALPPGPLAGAARTCPFGVLAAGAPRLRTRPAPPTLGAAHPATPASRRRLGPRHGAG